MNNSIGQRRDRYEDVAGNVFVVYTEHVHDKDDRTQ